jgi:hypothetical protein
MMHGDRRTDVGSGLELLLQNPPHCREFFGGESLSRHLSPVSRVALADHRHNIWSGRAAFVN